MSEKLSWSFASSTTQKERNSKVPEEDGDTPKEACVLE